MKNNGQRKKAVFLASMASNLDNFNRGNVKILQSLGYDITLASNFATREDSSSKEKIDSFVEEMSTEGIHIVQIDFTRSIRNIKGQLKSYTQVKDLLAQGFDLIHCHAPICSVITRVCAKQYRIEGTKVIYTAHGFHFYRGCPIKNWLFFYPLEKHLSRYTDALITINKEDYLRASKHFHAKKTVYIPGVGIDTESMGENRSRSEIRKELGIGDETILLLSVGELNKNKNHEVVIKALGQMPDCPHYIVAGKGDRESYLKDLISDLQLEKKVKLVGFRSDVSVFYDAADIFIFPSYREGLSVSLMEAMAKGLSVACGRIRGNTDLIDEKGGVFFCPGNINSVQKAIQCMMEADRRKMGEYNLNKIKTFDIKEVEKIMCDVYASLAYR